MKNGFTLIELIAVVLILSIILVISVPNLLSNIKDNKIKASQSKENIVVSAARNYAIDNELNYPFCVGISTLCNEGYIECPILDASGEEMYTSDTSESVWIYADGSYVIRLD